MTLTPEHPCMLTDHYLARVREMRQDRQRRLGEIRDVTRAVAYQERVREVIRSSFSPLPPRTALHARSTSVLERPGFRIEAIRFESRPGCVVTANLYLPDGCDARHPRPAVIADCGHSLPGKATPIYQEFPQRLAAAGFATLLIEPFGQGERDQYRGLSADLRAGLSDSSCHAHNLIGLQLALVGEFFGAWRAWDGMRGIDYLLSREDVDPTHLGVCGCSGGGTMATALWALDQRITMAAASCSMTSFACNVERQLPADCEQCPPAVLASGLDMADFFIARAPLPALLLGEELDYFDVRGLREAHAEIRRFYQILGAPADRHQLFVGGGEHGFSPEQQRALVSFFSQHAGLGPATAAQPPFRFHPSSASELWATPEGDVLAAGGRPVYELIAEIARAQAAGRPDLPPAALGDRLRRLLALDDRAGTAAGSRHPPHMRVLPPRSNGGVHVARAAVETEVDIRCFLYRADPPHAHALEVARHVVLHLPHLACAEAPPPHGAAHPQAADRARLVLEARGLGNSRPTGDFFQPYGLDYLHHAHGLMFSQCLLGRRIHDVLRTIDLLVALGARRIDLSGEGQGAILALFAGALQQEAMGRVDIRHGPVSYLELATAPVVRWPAACIPPGILAVCDLPDLVHLLGERVAVTEPWDALMQPYSCDARPQPAATASGKE